MTVARAAFARPGRHLFYETHRLYFAFKHAKNDPSRIHLPRDNEAYRAALQKRVRHC